MAMNSTSEGWSPIGNSSMEEVVANQQALVVPVPVRPSEQERGDRFGNGENREHGEETEVPDPRRSDRDDELWNDDRSHHDRLPRLSMGAKWAMLHPGHVDVACHCGSGPERTASAPENQRAKVDEQHAIGGERDGEGRPFRELFREHGPIFERRFPLSADRSCRPA